MLNTAIISTLENIESRLDGVSVSLSVDVDEGTLHADFAIGLIDEAMVKIQQARRLLQALEQE